MSVFTNNLVKLILRRDSSKWDAQEWLKSKGYNELLINGEWFYHKGPFEGMADSLEKCIEKEMLRLFKEETV